VRKEEYAFITVAACVLGWLLTLSPPVVYLATSWKERRKHLFGIMTPTALREYYKQFSPSIVISGDQLQSRFQADFDQRYGWKLYLVPLFLLSAIAAVGLWGSARTLQVWVGIATDDRKFAINDIALSALLGGITWVVSDQLARLRRRDFTSHDIYNCVFRLLIAVPLGYSVAAFIDDKFKVPVAFLLGAFPTTTLFTIARRLGGERLKLGDDAVDGSSELEKLPSVGKAMAERLKDEGVNSIAELAYADPVNLTIRTNKQFTYVTDCISQALLWIYIQDSPRKLAMLSLRGAQEVNTLMGDLASSTDDDSKADAEKTLAAAAAQLGLGKDELRHTFSEVAYDPYTLFLVKIWDTT